MKPAVRLTLSAVIAFTVYGSWGIFANRLAVSELDMLLRIGLLQGLTSAAITLGFTFLTQWLFVRFQHRCISFAFVTPVICLPHHHSPFASQFRKSFNQSLDTFATHLNQSKASAALLTPLIPMIVQAGIVTSIHWVNQTPNILLTIAPSILFSGLYGYSYSIALSRRQMRANVTNS